MVEVKIILPNQGLTACQSCPTSRRRRTQGVLGALLHNLSQLLSYIKKSPSLKSLLLAHPHCVSALISVEVASSLRLTFVYSV